ncbi:zinc finger protein 91 [Halyomorpha halys]|uniref:zinc finger protein 91 n=1 Tax=Halyomorpha halys TaxID=286706 RepID=UPI0006D4CC5E|nr:gastrula zinc finger protein xFG20-1-like [Halyomorpha halys]
MAGSEDEDDDTHFCIKCHATMRGLDTYVAHRRAKCRPDREKKAHDFFSSLNLQSSSKSLWPASAANDAVEDQVEERREIPPPGHTGGKWKPEQTEISEHQVSTQIPPPDHTRGKWGPAERPWGQLQKGYWCGPCNRRLSSRVVYERHIRSELHFKRTNQWPGQDLGRRSRVRTRAILATSLKAINRRYRKEKQPKELIRKKGGTMVCEVCKCKVWPHLIGKHLVSHYHYRHRKAGSEALVFQNMDSVVRQAPFQCGLCKFYTNTFADFIEHWTSDMHRQADLKLEGRYWCCICKCSSDSSVAMGFHIESEGHKEMVSVINRSVPIVIQKRILLQCEVCSRSFRYNMELKAHARRWGHEQTKSSGSDSYQEVTDCEDCDFRGHSLLSYQRHLRMKHGKEIHFCRRCNARFDSLEEARRHRKEAEHRDAGPKIDRQCPHCFLIVRGLLALKEHLQNEHPERRHRCLRCGADFILKQELTQHVKNGRCSPTISDRAHKCIKCHFSTDSEAELLLHNILHREPDEQQRYLCFYCDKYFKKDTLRNHVKVHTTERNYICQICELSFSRSDALAKHTSRVHEMSRCVACRLCAAQFATSKHLNRHMSIHHERTKNFACSECSSRFYNKASLEKHIQLHEGKKYSCDHEGCIFKGRSEAELRTHRATHGSERNYHCRHCPYSAKTRAQLTKHIKSQHTEEGMALSCPHCDFTTKNRTHLQRHTNLHTGQKPFRCPHCPFSCTLLENLRKHVISSKLHPGKFLYECPDCDDLKTNLSKVLKAHLVSVHGRSASEAAAHISGVHRPEADTEPQGLVPVPSNRRKKSFAAPRDQEEEQLPTLASVALASNEEDVIFIEVDGGLESVLYQQSDHLEAYPPGRV